MVCTSAPATSKKSDPDINTQHKRLLTAEPRCTDHICCGKLEANKQACLKHMLTVRSPACPGQSGQNPSHDATQPIQAVAVTAYRTGDNSPDQISPSQTQSILVHPRMYVITFRHLAMFRRIYGMWHVPKHAFWYVRIQHFEARTTAISHKMAYVASNVGVMGHAPCDAMASGLPGKMTSSQMVMFRRLCQIFASNGSVKWLCHVVNGVIPRHWFVWVTRAERRPQAPALARAMPCHAARFVGLPVRIPVVERGIRIHGPSLV